MKYNVLVHLKIPDNTAFTTHRALQDLGFNVDKVERADWYEIETTLTESEVKKLWETADVLANTNKHRIEVCEKLPVYSVVVFEEGNAQVLVTLKHRFNINSITSMKKGVWWNITPNKDIKKITEELLYSKHYQKYEIK